MDGVLASATTLSFDDGKDHNVTGEILFDANGLARCDSAPNICK